MRHNAHIVYDILRLSSNHEKDFPKTHKLNNGQTKKNSSEPIKN